MARVLITRAEPDATALAQQLALYGHEGLRAPMAVQESVPLRWPGDPPDALIFTSRLAPACVPGEALRKLPVFTIGPRTADAARQAGFGTIAAEGDGTYATLLEAVARAPVRRVWHIGGADLRHAIDDDLARVGKSCLCLTAYRMVPTESLPAAAVAALGARAIDMLLVLSPRTAAHVCRRIPAVADWLSAWCISDAVADVLRQHGWQHVHVAGAPSLARLLADAGLMCEEAASRWKGQNDDG